MNIAIKTLIEFGLSEKEAKIYLALLELGATGANEVAKKVSINRSSIYVVIESLKKKGLVSMTPDKSSQKFSAVTPETLHSIISEKNRHSLAVEKKIEEMLPELRALNKNKGHMPKVMIYEGDEATRISYYSTFDSQEFRIFKDLDGMSDVVPEDYVKNDAKKRAKNGVKMFLISPNTPANKKIVKEYKEHGSPDQFALIPENKFSKSGNNIGIGIFKDRIKFASAKNKFAIYIIDQAMADTLRDLFDLAWGEAKKLDKEK